MRYAFLFQALAILFFRPLIAPAQDAATTDAKAESDATTKNLQWKTVSPSPFARVEAPTAAVKGKLYLFGGFTSELGASPQIDVYDPAADMLGPG